jgi:hypothetical protein
MRASFEHNLLPLFRSHPETEFDLIWPPYSILVWLDFAQRNQVQVSLGFKRYVFGTTRGLGNVRVIDLQSERVVTHDLDRYDDIYHFDPAINEWLVAAACEGRNRVDAGSIDALERQLQEQVATVTTPAGLAAVIGAPRELNPLARDP